MLGSNPGIRPPLHPNDEDLSLGTPAAAEFTLGYFLAFPPGTELVVAFTSLALPEPISQQATLGE